MSQNSVPIWSLEAKLVNEQIPRETTRAWHFGSSVMGGSTVSQLAKTSNTTMHDCYIDVCNLGMFWVGQCQMGTMKEINIGVME